MRVDWFNVNIMNNGSNVEVIERRSKMGKYASRKDIEPLFISLQHELKNTKTILGSIKEEIHSIRKQFDNNDSKNITRCDNILRKLESLS